jgi:hypothetical protein
MVRQLAVGTTCLALDFNRSSPNICVKQVRWRGLNQELGSLITRDTSENLSRVSTNYTRFDKRRGFAYGILFGAAGVSGTGLPFLIQILLTKYGFAATLRGYAVGLLVVIGPTLPLCRGRLVRKEHRKVQYTVIKNPVIWAFFFSNLFQGFAFYLPGIYLPSKFHPTIDAAKIFGDLMSMSLP